MIERTINHLGQGMHLLNHLSDDGQDIVDGLAAVFKSVPLLKLKDVLETDDRQLIIQAIDIICEHAQGGSDSTVKTCITAKQYEYVSPCPEGYDTILGYLAKHNPEALELIDKDPDATQRDGFWCMHRSRERGITVQKVAAPKFLAKFGIDEVNAYPIELLEERFA